MRPRMLGWAIASGAVLGCGSGGLGLAERAVIEQALEARTDAWVRAANNRNLDTLAGFYHPGPKLVVTWPDGRQTHGWREEAAMQKEFASRISHLNVVLRDPQVDVIDRQAAVVTFGFSVDAVEHDRRTAGAGDGTAVWGKEPTGQWKIRALHLSLKG